MSTSAVNPPASRGVRNRAALAAFLNAVFPGTGHWYLGYRRSGRNMMLVTGGALLLVVLLLLQGEVFVAKLLVQPSTLLLIYAANAVFFFYRAWAATRGYQLGAPTGAIRSRWTPAAAGLALAATVTIVLPHAVIGYYDLVQYDLVTSVFGSGGASGTATGSQPSPDDEPGLPSGTTIPATTTTTVPPPLWEGQDRLNVLLLGSDAGVGRRGVRTDTMIVASIQPGTGYAAMFSVPRNFVGVPVPEHWNWDDNAFPSLINELYQYGNQNPETFAGASDPGAAAMKGAFAELLGIPIHYYALVNLQGFVDLIDAIGGVTITVTSRVYDEAYPHEDGSTVVIDIEPGTYHMDGHLALAYARSRRTSDDYNRMGRQRCVLEAVLEEASPATVALRFPAIANAIKGGVTTDIPVEQLPNLIELLPLVSTDEIVTVRFIPPDWHSGRTPDRYPIPDVAKIQHAVDTIMRLSPAEAVEVLGLIDLDDACDLTEPEPPTEDTSPTTTPASAP